MKFYLFIFLISTTSWSICQNIIAYDNWICPGDELTLFTSFDTSNAWATTAEPDSIFSTSHYITVQPQENTTYLLYTSQDTTEFFVKVGGYKCYCNYYVPNYFTPDGDQYNEVFKPIIVCDHWGARLTIYNRGQKVVYDSQDQNPQWDGRYQKTGKLMEDGIYIWQLSFISGEGETIHLIGHVLLAK